MSDSKCADIYLMLMVVSLFAAFVIVWVWPYQQPPGCPECPHCHPEIVRQADE